MRQDLTDWLNGGSGTEGAGLLLAPLDASSEHPAAAKTEKPDLLLAPGAALEGAASASKPEPKPELKPAPQPSPKPELQPEPELKPEPEPQPVPEPQSQPEPESEPAPLPEPKPQAEPVPELEPEPTTEPEPAPPIEAEPQPETEPEPQAAPEPEIQRVPEPEPEPASQPEVSQEPRPMPSLWAHAVSMPDYGSIEGLLDEEEEELEESEGTRNKTFTRKLHKGLQERKSHAMERRAQKPARVRRYWPRALAFCIVLILTLAGAWAMLRYLQGRVPQPLDSGGLAQPAPADVQAENVPAASGEAPPAQPAEPVKPVEKPAPPEKAIQPVDKPVQPVENPKPSEKTEPVREPVPEEKPVQPVEKPAPVKAPAPAVEKPMPPANPAPAEKSEEPILPLSYEGQIRLGTAALNSKRYDDAFELFSRALERRKDDPRAWLGVVAAFEGRGAVGEAFRVLVDARNALPRNPTLEVKLRELQRRVKQRFPTGTWPGH